MRRRNAIPTTYTHAQDGFTLVELLLVIILSVFFSTLVISFMLDFWGGTATLINDSETLVQRNDAGDSLRNHLNAAKGLIEQNSIPDPHPMVPDPSDSTGTYWLLIHAIPSSIMLPSSGSYTSVFYFNAPSINSSKSFIMNGAQPYLDEFVLYLNGSTKQLLLRTIANPSAPGDTLKTSCPSNLATSSCPADTVIADNVNEVDTNYYSRSGLIVNFTSATDPTTNEYDGPDFPAVDVAQLTIHFYKSSVLHGDYNTINQIVIRVALRNS